MKKTRLPKWHGALTLAALAAWLLGMAAIALPVRAVPVSFQVRMGYLIEQDRFDPGSDFVDLAGTFNGWGTSPLTPLSDDDADTVYGIVLDGFMPGSEIEFKFRINGQWDGSEEFPGGGPNRRYTVQETDNEILVWYNNELPDTGPPLAGFDAHPRKLRAGGLVAFEDLSAGEISWRDWQFEGGDPASSGEEDPVILYPDPGLYDVRLAVGNDAESDTLILPDFIEVDELGLDELAWWNDTVFYELFVRSFYDSDGDGIGDFQGITQKLDYLNDGDPETDTDLGVTGIWLMPIHESPSYHGYDVVDYRSINPDYGTMADFQAFLAAAHQRGIRVIIDYVMNHSSSQHPWFEDSAENDPQFRDFYRWSDHDPGGSGPWGQQVWHYHPSGWYYGLFSGAMPDLNYETEAVEDSIFDTAAWWLQEIGVDGFRLDAVLYILEDGDQLQNTQATYDFWHDFNQRIKAAKPDAMSVGEAWTNSQTILNYVVDERLDFCFEFDLAYSILGALNAGNAHWLGLKAQEVYGLYPHLQFGTFLTNHDQDRVLNALGHDEARNKVAAGIYLTLPGVPFLYYGEEIGMVGAGPHPVIRRPMQWTDGINAGFSTGVPWTEINDNYESYNVLVEESDPNSLLRWYRQLVAIRSAQPALRRGEYFPLAVSADPAMAFLRRFEGQTLLVLANTGSGAIGSFDLTAYGNSLPAGSYTLANLLDDGDSLELVVNAEHEIHGLALDAHAVKVYEFTESSGTDPGDGTPPAFALSLEQNYPNPFNPVTTIEYSLPEPGAVNLRVFDIAGRELAVLAQGPRDAGAHELHWNAFDDEGKPLSAGVYFVRLDAGGRSRVIKITLLK